MGNENIKELVPRDLPPTLFLGNLREQIGSPYKTRETIYMIENPRYVHKIKDVGDMDFSWNITIKDEERLRRFLTPTIHTLPNLEPEVEPYMPLGPIHESEKIVREEEQNYDVPRYDGVIIMSTSTHPIFIQSDSDMEDVFSSTNIPDYSSASSRNTFSDTSEDPSEDQLVPIAVSPFFDDPYMQIRNSTLEILIEDIQEYCGSLTTRDTEPPIGSPIPLSPSSSVGSSSPVRMAPKRTSTSAAPAMTQASIRKLIADSVATALEAPAATMENTNNTNRNVRQRETHVAKKCSYKEFMRCQPLNLKCTKGAVGLIRWFERAESVFSRKEAYKITWSELKRLLTKKYCPRTEVKKIEDEFYSLTIRGNDIKTYVRRFQELAALCPNMTCNKVGYQTKNCRNKGPATGSNLQPVSVTCHAYGEKRHYKNQCPKANNSAHGRAYMLKEKNAHQDLNVVTSMFLLNQHLAKVLFDSGADKSFISISLSFTLNIPPITIDTLYDIKMADGNLYHAKILCDEKVVHIPIDGETLIIRGDRTQVMKKKSDEKRLEDIPLVREFPEVFLEDLPGLPPDRQVEFQIDFIPGAALVARAPYRLALSEMQELSD
nr:hypothetical protein [Tanacetum cinerariifolium]